MQSPETVLGTASTISRRTFVKYGALTASAVVLPGCKIVGVKRAIPPSETINVAVVGAGGKGGSDTDATAKVGGNIVALCDIDKNRLDARGAKYPKAQRYTDFRKMLTNMESHIDAVIVSTPDHLHAPASLMAMEMGKHCFCQKPLTHSVYEARRMRDTAKRMRLATQMGNQGSAGDGLRRAVEVIQAGGIGKPLELHVWSNRPIWPQGVGRPEGQDPVPDGMDWDLWLGPAPFRPYKKGVYHPFKWRGWQDFGTGALGDMACHTVNMPFRALKLGYPTEIEAESTGINKETYPKSSRIRFQFPAREGLPPLTFWWYDGRPNDPETLRPRADTTADIVEKLGKLPGSGCLIIGDKGRIFSPDDYGSKFFMRMNDEPKLVPSADHESLRSIPETIVRSPGHYQEWIDAMRGGRAAYSNFDIAAYLTEIILLGCVALRVGKKLEWDGPGMSARNAPEASQFVRREYRKGWNLS